MNALLSEGKLLHLEENKKETKKWFNALGRSTPFGGTKFWSYSQYIQCQ